MGKMARTIDRTKTKDEIIVTLKVTLRDIQPPVWRRLRVSSRMTLGKLHQAIQAAMGWEDSHLHAFEINGRRYGDRTIVDDVTDEKRLTLDGVMHSGVTSFTYAYDFGDDWEHTVVIEATAPADDRKSYPACIAGKRNCPPEDCGGPWGYGRMLEILADPAHPEHAEQLAWVGNEFDPEDFAVAIADAAVAARFNRRPVIGKR